MSQQIEFEKLRNTRDLGGMKTADGRKIRRGKLIRSGGLYRASENDIEKLGHMIDTIVDFRSDNECSERPEPAVNGAVYYHIPILEKREAGVTRDEESYEEVRKNMLVNASISRAYMMRTYKGFISSAYSRQQYERFIRLLMEDHEKAVLWHCTAGKDRAGFGTVIIQEILGISREDIFADYLMTNDCLSDEISEIIGTIREAMGGEITAEAEQALRYMFAAWREYLEAAYTEAETRWGSFDRYIRDGLHITDEERAELRNIYLE